VYSRDGKGGRYIRREKKKGGTERKIEGRKSEQRSLGEMLRSGGPRGGIDSVRAAITHCGGMKGLMTGV